MKNKITIKNTIASLCLQIVTIISGFIIPKLLLKTFGSEVNGLVSSLNQFLNYITLIEGGLTSVVLASLYKPLSDNNTKKVNGIVLATNKFFKKIALIFFIYTIVLSIMYPLLVNTNFSFSYICTLTLILSINLFMQYFFSITCKTLLQADKKISYISIIQIICIVINTIGVYIILKVYPQIHVVKLVTSLIYLIQPIVFNYYVDKHYRIDKKATPDKTSLKDRWSGFGINMAAFIHNNTDVIILTIFSDLKSVSIYTIYTLVTQGLKQLIQAISRGIIPSLGHAYASGDNNKLDYVFNLYELLIYIVTFTLFTAGGLLITPFVQIYTKGINDATYFQPILGWLLILAEMTFCIREPYVNMAYSAGKFKNVSLYAYIEAIINIVLSLIFVWKFGIIGVALGTLIAMIYRTAMHIWFLKKDILKRKLYITIKKLLVFGSGFIISIILSKSIFEFKMISFKSWLVYAIENTLLICSVFGILVAIFYRQKIKDIVNIMKNK